MDGAENLRPEGTVVSELVELCDRLGDHEALLAFFGDSLSAMAQQGDFWPSDAAADGLALFATVLSANPPSWQKNWGKFERWLKPEFPVLYPGQLKCELAR